MPDSNQQQQNSTSPITPDDLKALEQSAGNDAVMTQMQQQIAQLLQVVDTMSQKLDTVAEVAMKADDKIDAMQTNGVPVILQ